MAEVDVIIEETGMDGEYGAVDGVTAECSECGHTTESFGTSDRSRRRCLVLMREECPLSASNYYVEV